MHLSLILYPEFLISISLPAFKPFAHIAISSKEMIMSTMGKRRCSRKCKLVKKIFEMLLLSYQLNRKCLGFSFFCSRLTLFSFFCVYSNVLFAPSTNSSYFMWVQQCSSMHALHDIAYHCLDMIVKRYFSFVFLYACELQNYLAKTKSRNTFRVIINILGFHI